MPLHYPFSAVVGSDDMALALTLTAVSPQVGGVLIRGEKGTAKSTMVRALAGVLPEIEVVTGDRFSSAPDDRGTETPDGRIPTDAPTERRPVRLVELPVGVSEDRITGSLHLESALSDGVTVFQPGLLARAHRGILYVDEVNLLHDHVVDQLLDAAAMGRVTVERDGLSVEHAARFVLVGTMNPEEGELRPQLLDRFGLTVEVAAPRDPELRAEVVRRRIAFEADPAGFAAAYADDERALRERVAAARRVLGGVRLTEWALATIARVCAGFDVDGMRADIVTARAAAAHAAWHGRTRIGREDIRVAARMALPHRRRRAPFDAPGLDEELLDRLLGDDDEPDPGPHDEEPQAEDTGPSESADDSSSADTPSTDQTPAEASAGVWSVDGVSALLESSADSDGPVSSACGSSSWGPGSGSSSSPNSRSSSSSSRPGASNGARRRRWGSAMRAATRMSSRPMRVRPCHAAWAAAARAVTMSARMPSTSKPAQTRAMVASAHSVSLTPPRTRRAAATRSRRARSSSAYAAANPAGSASNAMRRRTTSARSSGSRGAATSTVRPKRSSSCGRSSPSSGFMVPTSTKRAACSTDRPSRSTVTRPIAAASRSWSTTWSWSRLTSST